MKVLQVYSFVTALKIVSAIDTSSLLERHRQRRGEKTTESSFLLRHINHGLREEALHHHNNNRATAANEILASVIRGEYGTMTSLEDTQMVANAAVSIFTRRFREREDSSLPLRRLQTTCSTLEDVLNGVCTLQEYCDEIIFPSLEDRKSVV